jgi:hypothetical protein
VSAMNRRDLLKFAAGAPLVKSLGFLSALDIAAPAMAAPAAMYQGRNLLNVFLHGMFAVHFVDDTVNDVHQVILYPPHVNGKSPHSYFASDLTGNPAHFLKLDQGSSYSFLDTVQGADTQPTNYSPLENVVVPMSASAGKPITRDLSKPAHCKIKLPMPHSVIPRRLKYSTIAGQALFTNCKALKVCPDRIPLITVLQYDLGASGTAQDNVSKYHFFAEPELCPVDIHSSEALDALKILYKNLPNNLTFNACLGIDGLGDIPEDPHGQIVSSDEQTLIDLLHPSTDPCKGSSNCLSKLQGEESTQPKTHALTPSAPKPVIPPGSHAAAPSKPPDTPSPSGQLGIHPTACMSVLFVPIP